MARQRAIAALVVCAALALSLATMEVSIRIMGDTDSNGQFVFGKTNLPPYVLPVDQLERKIQAYLQNEDKATIIPDAETGWTYRPNSQRQNGEFTINSAELRALREYTLEPAPDTLRIALFGDSFVAGDEVNDQEVWGSRLEQQLLQAGFKAETLNFGVGGYGMGQAFLRWQSKGKNYAPDIVVFVFQAENLDRNVNLFRLLYPQGGIVYSKPRFVLNDGKLRLLNSPALPPVDLMGAFEVFNSHPLSEHEAYFEGRDFTSPLWNASKLAGVAHVALDRLRAAAEPAKVYGPASERGQLGKAIVAAFAADAGSSDAIFFVLHLPRKVHLKQFHNGEPLPWRFLLDHFRDAYHFINAEDFLGVEYTADEYFQPSKHYGPAINARVAEVVSAELVTCIQEASCELSRFNDISDIRN